MTIRQRRMRRMVREWRADLLVVVLSGVVLYGLDVRGVPLMGAPRDHELYDIRRIMAILTAMPAAQRRRVWAYVNDRIELLPPHDPAKGGRRSGGRSAGDDVMVSLQPRPGFNWQAVSMGRSRRGRCRRSVPIAIGRSPTTMCR